MQVNQTGECDARHENQLVCDPVGKVRVTTVPEELWRLMVTAGVVYCAGKLPGNVHAATLERETASTRRIARDLAAHP